MRVLVQLECIVKVKKIEPQIRFLPLLRSSLASSRRAFAIIMTALTSVLALLPIIATGNEPGQEIDYPTALMILGRVITSTLLNLPGMPVLYWRYGRSAKPDPSGNSAR